MIRRPKRPPAHVAERRRLTAGRLHVTETAAAATAAAAAAADTAAEKAAKAERRKEIREWIGSLGQGTATVAVLISLGALLAARDANDATKTAASNQFTLAQQGQAADRFTQAVNVG